MVRFMARPREFAEDVVVAKARDAFWANGVAATSISDLNEATGLSVGSIYKAFGSKAGLFHLTLDDYLDGLIEAVEGALDSGRTPVEGIEAWFALVAAQASGDSATRGCYAVNCTTELAERDPEVRTRLQEHDHRLRARVAGTLRAGVAAGELSADPDLGARLLCTIVNGLHLESRKGVTLADAEATLALALRALV